MDKKLILTKVKYVKENIEILKSALMKYENIEDESEKILLNEALERLSEKIIESCIAINQELLSEIGCFSNSYYDSFKDLNKLNIFEKDFLDNIAQMAGYRNRLAHDYMDLNFNISFNTMKKIPEMFKEYLTGVVEYLDKF
jgi:uncharacterized protein YutE (UPF0331/DUF86 family)